MKGTISNLVLKDNIAVLRQNLDALLSCDNTDYDEILKISEQLDVLIVAYYYSRDELCN